MAFGRTLSVLALILPLLSVNGVFNLIVTQGSLLSVLFQYLGLRTKRSLCPDGINTAINQACCALFPIVDDLKENLFDDDCGDAVRGSPIYFAIAHKF